MDEVREWPRIAAPPSKPVSSLRIASRLRPSLGPAPPPLAPDVTAAGARGPPFAPSRSRSEPRLSASCGPLRALLWPSALPPSLPPFLLPARLPAFSLRQGDVSPLEPRRLSPQLLRVAAGAPPPAPPPSPDTRYLHVQCLQKWYHSSVCGPAARVIRTTGNGAPACKVRALTGGVSV